ncbi:hypothetical protein UPYG_G00354460 [Umbra pygmaea]|uniref:C-type lectin domain-containing protein n=1 Tax=Umbra pygmaea TaxID=75934 RepID=A0ABD0VZB6_UMBPY
MDGAGDGQKKCKAMGGDIVVIDSREEQIFIHGFKKSVWIGIYRKGGLWKWVNSTKFEPTYWMPGEPKYFKDNETCVEISQMASDPLKSWKAEQCSKKHWVCENKI